MTVRESAWPDGTPCWSDLVVPDRERALEFYGALFGWEFEVGPAEMGFYTTASLDGRPVVGLTQCLPGKEADPAVWTTSLATSDIEKTAALVAEAGGRVVAPPMEIPAQGWVALAEDAVGARLGLWQAGGHIGYGVANTPGAVIWNEGMSRSFPEAKAFYGKVFGYEFEEMPEAGSGYATIAVGGEIVGGIGELADDVAPEVPAHWVTCFAVSDTDAAVAKVIELGGTVVSAAADTPYGRIAEVTDDQGASFQVITPAA